MLPAFVHLAYASCADDMRATLDLLLAELPAPKSGSQTIVARLADVVLVQVLREWLTHAAEAHPTMLASLANLSSSSNCSDASELAQALLLAGPQLARLLSFRPPYGRQ
jgi:hypothetical protein